METRKIVKLDPQEVLSACRVFIRTKAGINIDPDEGQLTQEHPNEGWGFVAEMLDDLWRFPHE